MSRRSNTASGQERFCPLRLVTRSSPRASAENRAAVNFQFTGGSPNALEIEAIAVVVAVVLSGAEARRDRILDGLQRVRGEHKTFPDVAARDARDRVDVAPVARIQRALRGEIERAEVGARIRSATL